MGRSRRILYPSAFYHVMNRGGARRSIYLNDDQRILFLDLLKECSTKYNCEIHAYCLMDNHFHLLIRTPYANLSEAMHWITNQYSRKVNKALRLDGSIFRGRFKAIVVDADNYLVQVSRYIHLNPVKARICSDPIDYKSSSYAGYLDESMRQSWLHVGEVMDRLGPSADARHYASFVENSSIPALDDFFRRPGSAYILGSKQFQKYLLSTIAQSYLHSFGENDASEREQGFQRILKVVAAQSKISPDKILAPTQGRKSWQHSATMHFCKKHCGSSNAEIASWFQISLQGVSLSLRRFSECLERDSDLRSTMLTIDNLLHRDG